MLFSGSLNSLQVPPLPWRHLVIYTLLLMCCCISANGQQEGANWYFGYNAGLRFINSGPIVLTDGQIHTLEGVASISDKNGNLLFYTDGITVWNKNHTVMPNGTGLLGHFSSTQSAIVVPKVGDTTRYYLFTVDQVAEPNGLNYSIVNMNLDNGVGDIELKNQHLYTPVTEKITAVKHCNGRDIWVITHAFNSDHYLAYLITQAGIAAPIISSSGRTISGNTNTALGYLKASPDGKKLAAAHYWFGLDLLDFDNATGVVSNRQSLFLSTEDYRSPYGVEFSPDSKLLYATVFTSILEHNILLQYDILASNIPLSKQIIAMNDFHAPVFGALQIAPDGKIYMAHQLVSNTVSAINKPGVYGVGCDFNLHQIQFPLPNQVGRMGLPSFIQSFWEPGYSFSDVCNGDSILSFFYKRPPNINNVKWDFDDPLSGAENSSLLDSPSHTFSGPGIYKVKLIRFSNCGTDTLEKTMTIARTTITLGNDTTACNDRQLQLVPMATGGDAFLWQDGSTGSSFATTISGTYWVQLRNSTSGCTSRDSITLTFKQPPVFSLGSDTTICAGISIDKSVNIPGVSYLWSTGSTSNTQVISPPGLYWLRVNNEGCSSTDTIAISSRALPYLNLGNDTILCNNSTLALNASTADASYVWSDGTTGPTFEVKKSGEYWLRLQVDGCENADSLKVTYKATPQFTLGPDQSLCNKPEILLQPNKVYPFAEWQDGSPGTSFLASTPGLYYLKQANECGVYTDSIKLTKGICAFSIPNAFTPNGDGRNDVFKALFYGEVQSFSLKIFNRWGQEIYSTVELQKGWDGRVNGKLQETGTYVYLVTYKMVNEGSPQVLRGSLTLVR